MLRTVLQRVVRLAPGLSRAVWLALPGPVHRAFANWVHPIAVGRRGGSHVLSVPLPEISSGAAPCGSSVPPVASLVIPTFANRDLCAHCLASIVRNTSELAIEVLVVDNGSSDGTRELLERWARTYSAFRILTNPENIGFARAVNQALRMASAEYVVLLNDDTVVSPGWLPSLLGHLERDPALGLVCPVTNEIGNAAKVPISYRTLEEMEAFARDRSRAHAGRLVPTASVALFCAAARRSTLEGAGFLDERFEVGMFEDDDLSRTLERSGHGLGIALDAFVHHVGQATFGRLPDARYLAVWEANRRRFEEKWGVRWTPPGGGGDG